MSRTAGSSSPAGPAVGRGLGGGPGGWVNSPDHPASLRPGERILERDPHCGGLTGPAISLLADVF